MMKNGEYYALDMSGAQFGLTIPVMPLALYIVKYVRQFDSYNVFDKKP